LLVIVLGLVCSGCSSPDDIDSTYGRRRGRQGGSSVNGTGVLAGMFEQAGHQVTTWRRLSPKLEKCDTIVWAPDDFQPPTQEQRQWFEDWLANQPGRTLVYIGRDYDAAVTYWEKVQPLAPADQRIVIERRLAVARSDYDTQRLAMPEQQYSRWFTVRRDGTKREIRTLQGPWIDEMELVQVDFDASKTEIEMEGRLDRPKISERPKTETEDLPQFETLLASGNDVLVRRVTDDQWPLSQMIVVTNGSFLLNLPLVNKQHRILAGKLIAECGEPGKVVFLESGPGGPAVYNDEPDTEMPTGFEAFTVWPINAIMLHVTALLIVLCFALFAIFGRPRDLDPESRSDFGKHIQALGDLLERTQDEAYARARVSHYQQHVKRDSGVGHSEAKKAKNLAKR
jgi:hypothetical protein